jgi:aminoglycoside phosphotransferase (APT) family kinase protein
MEESDITRAQAAALSVAGALGLTADAAVVLHSSNKVALRLTPCDVVARVTREGQDDAGLEVERALRLAEAGCPVGLVEPSVEPAVYRQGGFAVTLWIYYEPVTPPVSPADYAQALAQLHAGMRTVDLASPRLTDRIAEAQDVAANPDLSPELAGADRELLRGRLADLRQAVDTLGAPEQLLHGEPHPGNVLGTTHGALFIDFETICRGPVEFDLAHVPEDVCASYPGINRELVNVCRQLVLAMVAAWRWRVGDEFPNRARWGHEFLRVLRGGPPWPTLDTLSRRSGLGFGSASARRSRRTRPG